MTERALCISTRLAEEIRQWASDELGRWPRDTAYAADLESLMAQLTAAQPAPDAVAEAAERVARYLSRRKKSRSDDPEDIHGYDVSPEGGFPLRASDLQTLVNLAKGPSA